MAAQLRTVLGLQTALSVIIQSTLSGFPKWVWCDEWADKTKFSPEHLYIPATLCNCICDVLWLTWDSCLPFFTSPQVMLVDSKSSSIRYLNKQPIGKSGKVTGSTTVKKCVWPLARCYTFYTIKKSCLKIQSYLLFCEFLWAESIISTRIHVIRNFM